MKLVIAIVKNDDGGKLMHELNKEGFFVTKISSTGGFLKSGNMTLMIGTEEESVPSVISVIKTHCENRKQVTIPSSPDGSADSMYAATFPTEIDTGGATVFVVDVERFEKL